MSESEAIPSACEAPEVFEVALAFAAPAVFIAAETDLPVLVDLPALADLEPAAVPLIEDVATQTKREAETVSGLEGEVK